MVKFKSSLGNSAKACLKIKIKGLGMLLSGREPLGSIPSTIKKEGQTGKHVSFEGEQVSVQRL